MDHYLDPSLSDAELVAACATVIDHPKAAPPSSFELHAPLELLARALLLERVPEPSRELARERLRWLAGEYHDAGPAADAPPDELTVDPRWLLTSLAAAGHGPILHSLRPRVASVPTTFGDGLVAMALSRYPSWRLAWVEDRSLDGPPSGDLEARLAQPRSPGDPGSDFIYPIMHLVDASGLAAEVLDAPLRGLSVDDAARTLLRVAARSMLQDAPEAAPYGWTHCLPMPRAVLGVGGPVEPELAVAVAATYVLGFRATQGR